MHIFFKKSSLSLFCIVIIIIHAIQMLYFEQSFFTNEYDVSYWKDRFEHSQWQLPLSKRIIGDDGLFSYVGYLLIKGDDPSFINSETPLLGKYLIGLSIMLFKSPAYYALFFGIGSILLFFLIAKKLFATKETGFFVTALIFLDPLIFTQFWKAWVDIPQLFFLLLFIFIFIHLFSTKKKTFLVLSLACGISLGFFSQTKPPILLPGILLLSSLFFFFKKNLGAYVLYLLGLAAGILLIYTRYFFLDHSFIDFLKLQKHVVWIYLQSKLDVHYGAILQTLIFGKFPPIVSGPLIAIEEWWVMWPFVTIVGITTSITFFVRKGSFILWKGLALFLLTSLLINAMIPAYPRYLVAIIPLLYLFTGLAFEKIIKPRLRSFTIISVLLFSLVHSNIFLLPSSDVFLRNFLYNFSNQYFHDIYQENLTQEFRQTMSRDTFRMTAQRAIQDATVKSIEVKEKERDINQFMEKGTVKLYIIYKTQDLGAFSEEKTVFLIKEQSQWKIQWDWNIVLNGFVPGNMVGMQTILGKRGSIINGHGVPLAQDIVGYLISVNPEKIDIKREPEMVALIGSISQQKPIHLQNAYLENALPDSFIPVATNFVPLSNKTKEALLSFPGLKIESYPARIFREYHNLGIENTFFEECCTRIYSSYNYHGVGGVEKEFDEKLWGHSGGSIIMSDRNGKIIRTIHKRESKNGEDVRI